MNRTKEWEDEKRNNLKPKFDALGITYCEWKGQHCTGWGDTFAHVLKRRHLGRVDTAERSFNISNVARLCLNCHSFLELLGEEVGGGEVQRVIDSRNNTFMLEDL